MPGKIQGINPTKIFVLKHFVMNEPIHESTMGFVSVKNHQLNTSIVTKAGRPIEELLATPSVTTCKLFIEANANW